LSFREFLLLASRSYKSQPDADTVSHGLGRYSVFVPPDPFEDRVRPFYFRVSAMRGGGQRALRPADHAGGLPAARRGDLT
jgi:hypothetical protein